MGLRRFFHRRIEDADLARELEAHIAHQVDENVASGMSADEARRQAYLKLGSPQQVRERVWQWNTVGLIDDLVQDLRYALRTLRRMPGFAAVALLTLALGSGATTVMFTVINGVLLKPLPYADPDRLVTLQEKTEKANQFGNLWSLAYPNYIDCKNETHSLAMAAWRYSGGTITGPGDPEYVDAFQISSELFSILGVGLKHGRAFLPEEDRLGSAPAVIISDGLWQRRFGGHADAIGKPLVYDEKTYSVVGIAPPGFRLNGDEADLFTPLGQDASPVLQNRERHAGINVVARLEPGATLSQARNELALTGVHLAAQYPKSNAGRTFIAEPLRPEVGDVSSTLWLLLGAVSLVLLIACANVASLLLARAVSREREFAMRVALGASRGRVVRQCLTESALLGLAGGLLGISLAAIGLRPFVKFWPGSLPRAEEVHLDWHVLLFALAVSLFSGVLFGLAPALRIPTRSIENTLRAGAKTIAGTSRRIHASFVVSEIALAVVLLISAGILGRTLLRLSSLDPGLNIHNVLVSRMALSAATLGNPARIRSAWQDALDRARAIPGVQSAAVVDTVPMRSGYNQVSYWRTPAMPPPNQMPLGLATSVTPDYLQVMNIPLLKGRFFNDHDRLGNEYVAIIDDVLAQQVFGKEDPVGKQLWIPHNLSPFPSATGAPANLSALPSPTDAPVPVLVVGVVGHVRHWGLAADDQSALRAQFYYPFAQVSDSLLPRWSQLMSLAVRTNVAPLNVVEALRREVRGASGDQVLYQVRTMDQLAAASLARQRFLLLLFGIFAALALLLACVGIYGVLAYLTSQRIPEFGIRMALGAPAHNVMGLVLRQSVGMIFVGAVVGIAAAFAASRLLEHLVPGVRSTDPLAFATMVFLLVIAALFASFIPARRASRVDPMKALRQE
jgi:predicted permease